MTDTTVILTNGIRHPLYYVSFITSLDKIKNRSCFQHHSYCCSNSTVCLRSISSKPKVHKPSLLVASIALDSTISALASIALASDSQASALVAAVVAASDKTRPRTSRVRNTHLFFITHLSMAISIQT